MNQKILKLTNLVRNDEPVQYLYSSYVDENAIFNTINKHAILKLKVEVRERIYNEELVNLSVLKSVDDITIVHYYFINIFTQKNLVLILKENLVFIFTCNLVIEKKNELQGKRK